MTRDRFARKVLSAACILLCCLTPRLVAASGTPAPDPTGLTQPADLGNLKYRLIGPAWGGRITRVAGVPGDGRTFYAATASSGIWKSEDGGFRWHPIFDQQTTATVGSITVAPSDPNVLYAGSGEANIRGNVVPGDGIYRSLDAGKSWIHVWKQRGQIGTMAIHPRDARIAYAAVLGSAFGSNPERGVYRTTDGGEIWVKVLGKDEFTGASDVALDPSNPNIVFAGLWQTLREPWHLTSGGPGSGLYVSRDGGSSWKQLQENGLPKGIWGKVGVAVAPSDGTRVYALIEAEEGGLFRSDDGGEKWIRINSDRRLRQRAWYYSTITVHPTNPDELWCPQVPLLRSSDGGKSFEMVAGLHHGDHHDLWIDPVHPHRIIDGNDGGVDVSLDGGKTWFAPPMPICQFYHVSVDSRMPFHVAGAMQDIGTAQGPSNSLFSPGIRNTDWYSVGGGEAGHVVSHPTEPEIVYAGEYGGYISRYDHRTRQAVNVSIYPENPSGHGGEDLKYRFQWTAPIAVSPHDPEVVYHAANVIFRSRDRGQTWAAISPDLTRNDFSKQKWSGGPITGDNTGVEIYGTVFALAESPVTAGVIWAGSDDGLVHLSRDGGNAWARVSDSIPELPEWGTVSMIEPSRSDPGTAYVVVDAHRLDDPRPYLYRTRDWGRTWESLTAELPADVYLHAVREDPVNHRVLYLGTERGVAFSRDAGRTWQSLRLNLPTVPVHDLQVTGDHLVIGTHGRSLWILDDLSVIRHPPATSDNQPYLYPAPTAVSWVYGHSISGDWRGENPPAGALIYYRLGEKPDREFALEILDESGRLVRTLSGTEPALARSSEYEREERELLKAWVIPAESGINRAVWDLRWDGAEMIPGGILDAGYPRFGPVALPGRYQLRLRVGEAVLEGSLDLVADPRSRVSMPELRSQLDFALKVRDAVSRLTRNVLQVQSIRSQLQERLALPGVEKASPAVVESAQTLISRLDTLESKFHNPRAQVLYDVLAQQGGAQLYSRLAPLLMWAVSGTNSPPQGLSEMFSAQARELERLQSDLGELVRDITAWNRQAGAAGIPVIWLQ